MKVRAERDQAGTAQRGAHNAAQRERQADDSEVKKLADTASVEGGETWGNASGHSGTRKAWIATFGVVAGFLLCAFGLTVGPHLLIWIGIGVIVVVGAAGMATHVWSDYQSEAGHEADGSAEPMGRDSAR